MSGASIEDAPAFVPDQPSRTKEARRRYSQKSYKKKRHSQELMKNWPFKRPLEEVIWATEEDLKIWRLEIEQRYDLLMEIRKLLAATGG